MQGLTFRAARVEDGKRLADIMNDPPPRSALTIAGSQEAAMRGGRELVRRGIALQIVHTTVAEMDGMIVGLMDAAHERRDTEVKPLLALRLALPVIRAVGIGGLLRLLRSRPAWARVGFDAVQGAYHIGELDVASQYRNRGIGAAFLRLAEANAAEQGCDRLSLTTDITNPARRLYEREGFRVVETKTDAAYERWSASPGRVLMIKERA